MTYWYSISVPFTLLPNANRIGPFNGTTVWSENGLDANDLLQRGLLAARLAIALADAVWEA